MAFAKELIIPNTQSTTLEQKEEVQNSKQKIPPQKKIRIEIRIFYMNWFSSIIFGPTSLLSLVLPPGRPPNCLPNYFFLK